MRTLASLAGGPRVLTDAQFENAFPNLVRTMRAASTLHRTIWFDRDRPYQPATTDVLTRACANRTHSGHTCDRNGYGCDQFEYKPTRWNRRGALRTNETQGPRPAI